MVLNNTTNNPSNLRLWDCPGAIYSDGKIPVELREEHEYYVEVWDFAKEREYAALKENIEPMW